MADVSAMAQRALVDGLKDALGGSGWQQRVVPDPPQRVLIATGSPARGYTTVVAHDLWTREWPGYPHRHVLLAGCRGRVDAMSRLLASVIAWLVSMERRPVPGMVVRQATRGSGDEELAARLPHARFDVPFPWSGEELPVVQIDALWVVPLLVYPISEAELQLQEDGGPEALDEVLERRRTPVLDPDRASAVRPA